LSIGSSRKEGIKKSIGALGGGIRLIRKTSKLVKVQKKKNRARLNGEDGVGDCKGSHRVDLGGELKLSGDLLIPKLNKVKEDTLRRISLGAVRGGEKAWRFRNWWASRSEISPFFLTGVLYAEADKQSLR